MSKPLILLLAFTAVLLSGCAGMSETQCKGSNWQTVGHKDGAAGIGDSRLAAYTQDCSKLGITPDTEAYRRGWEEGIAVFCRPANGWRQGVEGRVGVESLCRAQPGYDRFTHNLQAGVQLYRINLQLQANRQEINRLQNRLEASTSDTDKAWLRGALSQLDLEQHRLHTLYFQQRQLAPR